MEGGEGRESGVSRIQILVHTTQPHLLYTTPYIIHPSFYYINSEHYRHTPLTLCGDFSVSMWSCG